MDNQSLEPENISMNDKIFKRIKMPDSEKEVWVLDSRLKIF